MSDSIKKVFDEECGNLKIDNHLVRQLQLYQVGFVNKNRQHIEFFGGHLLGVQTVKFMPADEDRWFEDIIKTSQHKLKSRLSELPVIDYEHRVVGSDTMNLSCAWLTHAIYNSNLPEGAKKQAMVDVMLVLQYKFLTSRLYRHFKFPAQLAVAEATYAMLSGKFSIKQYGTWSALFQARAEEITDIDGIHGTKIKKFDNDEDIIDMLNDIQGRIRDMLKNIYDVFLTAHHQGDRIHSTSAVVEHDGAEILRDKTKNLTTYGRYINSVVSDRNSFIRDELFTIIVKVMHTMPPTLFRTTLEYMSDNYQQRNAKEVADVLNETILHSFDYISDHRELVSRNTDLAEFLARLRGVYMSSRSTDPILLHLRDAAEELVKKATGNKNDSVISSVRTGILLYVVLRTFTMKHYENLTLTGSALATA